MIKFSKISAILLSLGAISTVSAETRTIYSHGDPTPEEQHLLELINRARMDPAGEVEFLLNTNHGGVEGAIDYFGVNSGRLRKDFDNYPTTPPLAFNPLLMRSARAHSEEMANLNYQSHDSNDGTTFDQRIADTGYLYSGISENVYSLYVPDTVFAHAGFNIDWGTGPDGIQTGVGHRQNIMGFVGTLFKEVGIGVVARSGSSVNSHGKLAITQDFGVTHENEALLLGVVYSDKNGNHICDPGEGVPGVTVSPSSGNHYAVTSTSGGYAIPFGSAASGLLTFSGGKLAKKATRAFSIDRDNLKIDFITPVIRKASVGLNVIDRVARETGGAARFRIRRNGPDDNSLTVVIHRSKGNRRGKAAFSDYKLRGSRIRGDVGKSRNFRVTIPAGKSSAVIRLKAINDRKKEPREKVTFKIKPTSRYKIGKKSKAKIYIVR